MGFKTLTIFLMTLAALNSSFAQETVFRPDSLHLGWSLVRNQQGDSAFRCKLVFTNRAVNHLPASGWKIYFNLRYHGHQLRSLSQDFMITYVSGELFFIQPAHSFTGLGEGKTADLEFTGRGRIANYQDIPSGFFWVDDREPGKALPLGKPIVIRPGENAQWKERLPKPDNQSLFEENAWIEDIPVDKLPKIFPTPREWQELPGFFILEKNISIVSDNRFSSEAAYLAEQVRKLTGESPGLNASGDTRRIILTYEANPNPEAYRLGINTDKIIISAGSAAGIFYGIQSLKSALPVGAWSGRNRSIPVPCMRVTDAPQFPVREFMLDVARNFQTKDEILRILDLMAFYKLNVFHFHLTDDEGWRLAIPGLPELTDVGAGRGFPFIDNRQLHPSYGSGADGSMSSGSGYYTTEDFIQILKYARERHILVIPEIESPGHARAAIKSMDARYLKYTRAGDTAAAEEYMLSEPTDHSAYMSNQYFRDDVMNPALPSTYRFMEKVIDELAAMYRKANAPLVLIHVGGDEVPRGVWEKSPSVIQWIKENDNRNAKALWRNYFERIKNLLKTRGIGMTGWEELVIGTQDSSEIRRVMMNEGFIKDRVRVESWWNQYGNEEVAYKMANAGYPVILSFVDYFYFDLAYNKSFDEPGDGWVGYLDLQKVFSFLPYNYYRSSTRDMTGNPQPPDFFEGKLQLTSAGKANIAGIQCAMWGENLVALELLEYMLLPRLLAMAERAWSKEPSWSLEKNPAVSGEEYRKSWSVFANVLGKKGLPALDYYNGGYGYRIPPAAVVIRDKQVYANCELPGFTIRYTTDGTAPTIKSPLYIAPLRVKGNLIFRVFDTRGRAGAVVSVLNK